MPLKIHNVLCYRMRYPVWLLALFMGFSVASAVDVLPPQNSASGPHATHQPVCKNYQTRIQQSAQGGYWVDGYINNTKALLHVDTGADLVAVPLAVARSAGLALGQAGHAQTASDVVTMYRTVIPVLRVGDLAFKNVKAAINPNSPGNDVLLGMSALESVSFQQEQGVMVLSANICDNAANADQRVTLPMQPPPDMVLKRSVRDCMGPNNLIDAKVIECMKTLR